MTDTKKRSLLLAITVALVSLAMAVLLAGCASSSSSEDTTTDTTETAVENTESGDSALDAVTSTENTEDTADADANAKPEETAPAEDMTLEEWFDANPSEFQTMQDSFQQGFASGLGDSDISAEATLEAEGNQLVCKVTIGMDMTDEQIAAASEAMQPELVDYESSMKDLLTELEGETGCSPITMYLGYFDQSGKTIVEHTYE